MAYLISSAGRASAFSFFLSFAGKVRPVFGSGPCPVKFDVTYWPAAYFAAAFFTTRLTDARLAAARFEADLRAADARRLPPLEVVLPSAAPT